MRPKFKYCSVSNAIIGPDADYRGADATLTLKGRVLLGRIKSVSRNEVLGVWIAELEHFNGEPWPIKPRLSALELLVRTYENEVS